MDLLFHGYHLSLFIQNSHTIYKENKRYTSGNHNKVQLTAQLLRLPGGSLNCKGNHGVIAGILSGFCYNPSVPAVDFPDQDPFSYMDAEQDMAVCINALYGKMIA